MSDPTNPDHYKAGDIECIDAIKSALGVEGFKAFCQGNAIKYLWRYNRKGKAIEDLRKAQWYAERLIQELEDTSMYPVFKDDEPWHEGNIEQEYHVGPQEFSVTLYGDAVPDTIDDEPTAPHVPQKPVIHEARNECACKGSESARCGKTCKIRVTVIDQCRHGRRTGAPCDDCPGSYARRAM